MDSKTILAYLQNLHTRCPRNYFRIRGRAQATQQSFLPAEDNFRFPALLHFYFTFTLLATGQLFCNLQYVLLEIFSSGAIREITCLAI